MKTLVFDTETNGMRPKGRNNPLSAEPALVQLAAVLYIGDRAVSHMSFFVKPIDGSGNAATIPTEKFFIDSGITQDVVDACGVPLSHAMSVFGDMCADADRIAAHNVTFDDPVVRAAFDRSSASSHHYDAKPKICTMRTLEPILKIPGKYGYKFPSLDESYRRLVNPEGFDGAHDAMNDVNACADVLWAIEKNQYKIWNMK